MKVDSADPSRVIPNAVFEIKSVKGDYGPEEFITSQDGEIDLSMLPEGSYVVTEKSCPGYVIDEAQRIIHLDPNEDAQFVFTNSRLPDLLLIKTSADGAPLSDVEFFVTTADGAVVGNANGKFVTDRAGTFLVEGIEPNTTLIVKESRAKSGYLLDDTPQTVQIKAGQTVTLEFRNKPLGNLIIHKLSSADKKTPLSEVEFLITDSSGAYVGPNKGIYKTDEYGRIVLSDLKPGTVITAKETATVDGFVLDGTPKSIEIKEGEAQTLTFYNAPIGGLELIKVSEADKSQHIKGVTI